MTTVSLKPGDFVLAKGHKNPGIVLSVSTQVLYERAYARVIFEDEVRSINTSLLLRIE